jgi:multidrug efflux system outer membrane protein
LLIAICGVLAALVKEYDQTTTAAKAVRKAADLSLTPYRDGASSFLDVVTAQSAALDAERLAIALHTRQEVADIGLMLALGGGWTHAAGVDCEARSDALPR